MLKKGFSLVIEDLSPVMQYVEFEGTLADPNEPTFRSCWECNSAHEHLKTNPYLICFICGETFRNGEKEPVGDTRGEEP